MASSDSVDDSFRGRVEKVFGSLSSSQSASPWSLTDDEVEKREWRRDKEDPDRDDQTPCSSSFDTLFKKDRKFLGKTSRSIHKELEDDPEDLDDDDDDVDGQLGSGSKRRDADHNDVWEIRSSIGLDCTLDNEEEEDEFDKLAEGRENAGDRLYMRDVTDHGLYLNSHNVLPNSIPVAPRDPRANHDAAQMRLKEDEVAAEKCDSYQTCDKSALNVEEPCIIASADGVKLKSILKRKDNATVNLSKRVRFDPSCKDDCEEASEKNHGFLTGALLTGAKTSSNDSFLAENMRRVPDYVMNPSKYVRYSFDSSSDIDEESNSQSCMDFLLKPIKRPKSIVLEQKLEDASVDIPKSVMFIPRKKTSDAKAVINSSEVKQNQEQSLTQASIGIGMAAGEVQQSEVGATGEDEQESETSGRSVGFQKQGRNYRTKSSLEDTVS